jgi:zinc protease
MNLLKNLLYATLLVAPTMLFAQKPTDVLPNDPTVKTGKLKNGMVYYIRKNAEPKNRMELRLVVNAGSTLETDEQQGLAHFMEHMNFNGTKNFPKTSIVDFLQRSGLKFGADLNAYTGFDETVYQLQVPTDSVQLFNKAFQILEDWAHNATLDTAEINKERGVVMEEYRLRLKNAQERIQKQILPVITNNSRYAQRMPIGKEDILLNFKPEAINAFYHDWYRPDLMAVIAIGDFDVATVEKIINEHFSTIPMPAHPKARTTFEIPNHNDTKVVMATDKEFPQFVVQIYHKQKQVNSKTYSDHRRNIATSLYNEMLGSRLQELTKKPEPPFMYSFGGYGGFLGDQDTYQGIALAKSAEGVEKAMKTLVEENERIRKFGFTATELERAKKNYLAGLEKQLKEKDKTKSVAYVNNLVNNYLKQNAYTSIEFRNDYAQKNLETISLAEVNALANVWMTKQNRVVMVIAPEKDKDKLPKESQFAEWLDNAGKDVTPYIDNAANKPLLAKLPTAGKVSNEKKIADIGVTEWTLSNGAKVVLKPTDFKNDQILITAQSAGGTSLYGDADYDNADISNALVAESGIGEFSSTQLKKMMAGKVVGINPYIGETEEGFNGSCSPKDLETELQLLYGYFTTPRKDADILKSFMNSNREYLKNDESTLTPEKVFNDTIQTVLSNYAFRRNPMTVARWDKINIDKAYMAYSERFADASDFTFFLVGNFDTEKIKPLIEQYIGGLPSANKKESYKNLGIHEAKGSFTKTLYKGLEDKASVQLHFSGEFSYSPEAKTQFDALVEALDIKLIEKLREEESGVYSPSVGGTISRIPENRFSIDIEFGCAPKNAEKLIGVTMSEIEKLKTSGATPTDIEKYKAETIRSMEVKVKENGFWLNYLADAYKNNETPKEVINLKKGLLDKVTPDGTKAIANRVFGDNLIRFVLLPEKK